MTTWNDMTDKQKKDEMEYLEDRSTVPKTAVLITPEVLVKLGWSMKGNAWYPASGNKRLTNFENKFQSWVNGISKEVLYIKEI